LTPDFVTERDLEFGVISTEISKYREEVLNVSAVLEGADSWQRGFILNLGLRNDTADMTFSVQKNKRERRGVRGVAPICW
jgi:hypothetical protein